MLRVEPVHLARVEQPVREPALPRAVEDAGHELAIWRPDREPAGQREQFGATLVLEVPPERVGALEQRNVLRAFEVGGPEDAGVAV